MKVDVLKRIWERSLDLNQMVLLQLIGTNVDIRELLSILKVTGMITLLLKQELITKTEENILLVTNKGKELLKDFNFINTNIEKIKIAESYDYDALQKRLKDRLKELTGKSQYFLKVQYRDYPYIPSPKDLKDKIEKFKLLYKMDDMNKIEACLMEHLKVRNQKMIYYILREKGDGKSDLSADYDNFEETKIEETQSFETVL